jgi:beta-mannanase
VWGKQICGNTAAEFRAAWIHVWTIFHTVGATNVKFEFGVAGSKGFSTFYPGNQYVDYLGLTALNWGKNHQKPWTSLVNVMSQTVAGLRALNKKKPIIAAEVASGPDQKCADCTKASWISGFQAVYDHAGWGQVVAIVYLDFDMRYVGQPDWRLQSPQAALDAYNGLLANKEFQGTCC